MQKDLRAAQVARHRPTNIAEPKLLGIGQSFPAPPASSTPGNALSLVETFLQNSHSLGGWAHDLLHGAALGGIVRAGAGEIAPGR